MSISLMTVSCLGWKDDDSSWEAPYYSDFSIETRSALLYRLTASIGGGVGDKISECGFYLSENESFTDAERLEAERNGKTFMLDVVMHEYGKTYYVRPYLSRGAEFSELLGSVSKIVVKPFSAYVNFSQAVLDSYDNVTKEAVVKIGCEHDDGIEVTSCGICYGVSSDIDMTGSHVSSVIGDDGVITLKLPDIEVETDFWVRPYVCAGDDVVYGQSEILRVTVLPTVYTSGVSDITENSAVCSGRYVYSGASPVSDRGIVWGETPSLSIDESSCSSLGPGTNGFSLGIVNLKPATTYYYRAYAKNQAGIAYGDIKSFVTLVPQYVNLSVNGNANCYMVHTSGKYCFPILKGNGNESVDGICAAKVLWESFGTRTAPQKGDLIESVTYDGGKVYFDTGDTFKSGNAVIAVTGSFGEILWSWHIWFTDLPGECAYRNLDKTMMDRNVGATSAVPGEEGTNGLLYQWGRKDPFLGYAWPWVPAVSSETWPDPVDVSSNSNRGTVEYAIEHPMTFLKHYYNWCSDGNADLWKWDDKTIYDPCPPGWRVPDGGVWTRAGFDINTYDYENYGMTFAEGYCAPATWYPAAGYMDGYGNMCSLMGYYWSSSSGGRRAYHLSFDSGSNVQPAAETYCSYALPVRCIQE